MSSEKRDPAQALRDLKPAAEFFIGIDSDGCVFDSMEIKHKECFCPCFINHFDLQAVSKYARETWEFINLYSKTRGVNRYPAVIKTLDALRERPETRARGVSVPAMDGLRDWMARETKLSVPALKAELDKTGNADLAIVYRWSVEVNEAIEKMVRNVPPFPLVRESLEAMRGKADVIVVSQTPFDALKREWEEHGLETYIRLIAGQEMGSKTEHLRLAAGDKYPKEKILMLGDAPGDLEAARKNGALFYPIVPGNEEASWQRFHDEALGRFYTGTYAGAYEDALVKEFGSHLPELPSWKA